MSRKRPAAIPAKLVLTARALSDIRDIKEYSHSNWGLKIAEKYLDDIAVALDLIAENPAVLKTDSEFSTVLSFYRVRRHFLVCDFRDLQVVVLAVIHASMDIPQRLSELEPRLAAEVEFLHRRLREQ